MPEATAAAVAPGRNPVASALAALRFIATDRIGIALLAWLLVAFVARPLAMSAHYDLGAFGNDWLRNAMAPPQLAQLAGSLQWASLAGLILVMALVHVRLVHSPVAGVLHTFRGKFAIGSAYTVALIVGYLAFIWTPVTAVSLMLHDAFIFFDAIHRIDQGQVPSVDFPTPLGAAMLYLPWLGAKISGGYAGAIELSSAMVALFLCLACVQASAQRHPAAVTAVLVAAIFVTVVPAMLEGYPAPASTTIEGGKPVGISDPFALAMFYNRWGWGAIIAMLAFLTPRPADARTSTAEIVTLGLLLVFLFWLKLSYFAVGGAVAVLYAFLGQRPWRTLAIGAGVSAAGILVIGLMTGNLIAYAADIILTGQVSGNRLSGIFSLLKDNLIEVLAACSAIIVMALMRRLNWQDIAIVSLIVLGSLFLINQNAQSYGVPTFLAAGAYAVWRLKDDDNRALRLVAAVALALPSTTLILDRSSGLLGQTMVARREEARPAPVWADIPAMKGVYAQERESLLDRASNGDTAEDRLAASRAVAMYGRRQILRSGEYMQTLMAAMDELKTVMAKDDSVVVMDFNSPLSFLMQTRPAKGYWITFDDGRTISEDVAPAGEVLFADADHVMAPKLFMEPDTAVTLRNLYSPYLDEAYATRVETTYWVRWSHRKTRGAEVASVQDGLAGPATQVVAIR